MRLAVIGDIAGHHDELFAELVRLGMDPQSCVLPDDLQVCQLGDLVHRGPDSPGVLALVDKVMRRNPSQWRQLIGNHEAQYVFDPPRFGFPEVLDESASKVLQRWWRTGKMQVAAAYETKGIEVIRHDGHSEIVGDGGLLISHAGLTAGAWHQLGMPGSALSAAQAINTDRDFLGSVVWRAGMMLGGPADRSAGCVWAEASNEVYTSWAKEPYSSPGFNQVHGHTSAMWWSRGELHDFGCLDLEVTADYAHKHVRAEIHHQVIWGIDPGHGARAALPWSPLVFNDARPARDTPVAARLSESR